MVKNSSAADISQQIDEIRSSQHIEEETLKMLWEAYRQNQALLRMIGNKPGYHMFSVKEILNALNQ